MKHVTIAPERPRNSFLSTLPQDCRVHDVVWTDQTFDTNVQLDVTTLLQRGLGTNFKAPSNRVKWLSLRYRMRWYRVFQLEGVEEPKDFGVFVIVDTRPKTVVPSVYFGGDAFWNGAATTAVTPDASTGNWAIGALLFPNSALRAQARVVAEDFFVLPATDNGNEFSVSEQVTAGPPPYAYTVTTGIPFGAVSNVPDHWIHERFVDLSCESSFGAETPVSNYEFLPRILLCVVANADVAGFPIPGWGFDVSIRVTYQEYSS